MILRLVRVLRNEQISKLCFHQKRPSTMPGAVPELKFILAKKIAQEIEKIKDFKKKYGGSKVSEVTVDTIYGGVRGCICLWCDTSHLDPLEGIRFRGYSIPEIIKLLPKADGGKQPLPEGIFWLMLTGDVPSKAQVDLVSCHWANHSVLPDFIDKHLDSIPNSVHPMTQLSSAINLLNCESYFQKNLRSIKKPVYWEYMYEDSMALIPKLTVIAAKIYRNTFKGEKVSVDVDSSKDWALNFQEMLGYDSSEFAEALRLYLTIHADHEGGNVSSHTVHLIGSTLADSYLCLAGGMNGLAGPLHGLANQECLAFLMKIREKVGEKPTDEMLAEFVKAHMASGHVIPGFGHAVLRKTDPRFTCFQEFAEQNMADDPLCTLLRQFVKVAVPILQATGKVKNPFPNVDCHSGTILYHYGMTETNFYTVMFGVSRALGVLSSLIWHRAIGMPIERPNSITTPALMKLVNAK